MHLMNLYWSIVILSVGNAGVDADKDRVGFGRETEVDS